MKFPTYFVFIERPRKVYYICILIINQVPKSISTISKILNRYYLSLHFIILSYILNYEVARNVLILQPLIAAAEYKYILIITRLLANQIYLFVKYSKHEHKIDIS